MKITKEWLEYNIKNQWLTMWFCEQKETNSLKLIKKILAQKKSYYWAFPLIINTLKYEQYINLAFLPAKKIIPIYEKKYPEDNCLKNLIKTIKKHLIYPDKEAVKKAYETLLKSTEKAKNDGAIETEKEAGAYNVARTFIWLAHAAMEEHPQSAWYIVAFIELVWVVYSWGHNDSVKIENRMCRKIVRLGLNLLEKENLNELSRNRSISK